VINDRGYEARNGQLGCPYADGPSARWLSARFEREPQSKRSRRNGHNADADKPSSSLTPSSLSEDELLRFVGRRPNPWIRLRRRYNGDTMHVTMKDVKQLQTTTPLHDQIAAEIRRDIANGDVRPGQRLPPAKDMAAVLGVHPNTVLRALRSLRDEGILEFRRGRGITVVGEPEQGVVLAQARELVVLARRYGFGRDELISMLQHLP